MGGFAGRVRLGLFVRDFYKLGRNWLKFEYLVLLIEE